ncbi:MAG: hypothetical protein ACKV19_16550 [Verrucomicrobiales bacterium]
MNPRPILPIGLLATATAALAGSFGKPELLRAGGEPIKVAAPGYACPSWADWDGDGKADLLVGQFAKGAITVYKGEGVDAQGMPKLATGKPLMSGDRPVEVPGVW